MAINNNVFTMTDPNTETTQDLFEQLGTLLGVGVRSDGRYYLSDLCQAPSINPWAKYKPVDDSTKVNLLKNVPLGYRGKDGSCGIDFLVYDQHDIMGGLSTDSDTADKPFFFDAIEGRSKDHEYKIISGDTPNRLRDFDGYDHGALSIWNVTYRGYIGGRPSFGCSQLVIGSYAYASAISNDSPEKLTLIDLMNGLRGIGESSLVTYGPTNAVTTDIADGDSYGYIGLLVASDNNSESGMNVMFASKSVGSTTDDDLNSFVPADSGDSSAGISDSVIDAIFMPGNIARVVPVICNVNTNGLWKAVQLDRWPNFRAIPFPMSKTWYREYHLSVQYQDAFTTSTVSYPTSWKRGAGSFYVYTAAGTSVIGGITMTMTAASATLGVLSNLKYAIYKGSAAISTNKIGEGTISISSSEITNGTKTITIGSWQSGNVSDIFYQGTGYSGGLISAFSAYSCTQFFIQLAVDLPESSKWVGYTAGWDFNSGILITKNTSTSYPV